jgi:hypothetical protein
MNSGLGQSVEPSFPDEAFAYVFPAQLNFAPQLSKAHGSRVVFYLLDKTESKSGVAC